MGDYDNDGYPDLFVAGVHRNSLYHNNRDGAFTDVTARIGGDPLAIRQLRNVAADQVIAVKEPVR